ncbi:LysR family transcriptional regulator [Gluconobacter japonicus]|uniref:LysR family transcriptional regulator n=1 Tax=Gluconobacter japonicus TaxID=376620 RepID=A0ABQ5WF67_GLUJA|nr:LysR family transcriptional regulator [Gluconobacter japonicus]KXV24702.1 transcriptional regulator [Gluconobacter japonicus]GBR17903.1 transcriptional regulator [Gluconobacter japonicus NBRC 3271]GLQ58477.1 LysR family transcriptional regulator [Gluconobacter japonicus]
MLPDLEGWAVFARVAESGSFASAARSLGLSAPTVSKVIARLEHRLKTTLFQRSARHLSLTAAGVACLERARRMLSDGEWLEAELREGSVRPRGTIRLAVPMGFGLDILGPVLPAFLEKYPDISMEIDLDDRTVDLLGGRFEAAIRITPGELPPASSGGAHLLCRSMVRFVCSPELKASLGPLETPEDLSGKSGLLYANTDLPDLLRLTHHDGKQVSVRLRGRMTVNNGDMLLPALRNGTGLALLPDFMLRKDLEAGRLVEVLPGWQGNVLSVWFMVVGCGATRLQMPARLRVLLAYLEQTLGGKMSQDYSAAQEKTR